ncbi:unnamed protein product [Adineta steineri]|uniref:Uncharacterized protein n=1 Tax=Adineta steineri TaxID=433720 RepID=A0A819CPP8_9BILA|nr:unnamed protein product [Adineta steineri]CAF3824478.1 unnamed protein product [Adineta steineri]
MPKDLTRRTNLFKSTDEHLHPQIPPQNPPSSNEPLSDDVITALYIVLNNINIHEDITSSSISNPSVVYIQNSIDLYLNYDQPCSSNSTDNRYFICRYNFTWACLSNTYYNSIISMCSAQLSVPLYPLWRVIFNSFVKK